MDDKPNDSGPTIPTWVWILGVFAIILGLQLWVSGRFNGPDQVGIQEVMTAVQNGDVKSMVVTGDRIEVEMNDGTVVSTTKHSRDSLAETFEYYGVTAEQLQTVDLTVNDQSTWNNLFTILISVGPVILLIWIFSRGFRQMQGGGGNNIFGFGRSRAKNLNDANRPTVTFD
ncbi:MAG: hypothetical protein KC441_15520, partial [Anaerolineales bacterium]|nr:hypothetical protein [Anaerolineales bacterium]